MSETKEKILDAAERLIAEQGVSGTSLRQVVAEAGVNLAAVHYHFGSKDELVDALVRRKAEPVNAERLRLLDIYEAEAEGRPVPIEKILTAFLTPMRGLAIDRPLLVRVMGRIVAEGLMHEIIKRNFQGVIQRFTAALRRARPDLSEGEFHARIQFMTGVVSHTMHSLGKFDTSVDWMKQFLAGGFNAPPTEKGIEQ